jgi:long-chain acyl-CoA synthetase
MSSPPETTTKDIIAEQQADTLAGVFLERVRRSADRPAYRQFDPAGGAWVDTSWRAMARDTARWRKGLADEGLQPGDRVAIMLRNCREWACFDLAAQSLGLVTVPLYTNDRPDNVAYILEHAGARLLLIGGPEWPAFQSALSGLNGLETLLSLEPAPGAGPGPTPVAQWLPPNAGEMEVLELDPGALATIVYTSGTTGRPKGVMLSHHNILWNIRAGLQYFDVYPDDLFLSFLPLSHTLERSVGLYLPILTGSTVAYARSIPQLGEDLQEVRPTILISVPRIFERVYGRLQEKVRKGPALSRRLFQLAVALGWREFLHRQGRAAASPGRVLFPLLDRLVGAKVRARLGGRLRFAVCGGAPLAPQIAQLFIGLGIPITQGYGLTESSPVVSGNRLEDNRPDSVGTPLPGVEVRVGERQELLTRSPSVMLGYWADPQATAAAIDADGWLHTGDRVRIEHGHIYITGRLKEVIVLANGEKVSPGDMEMAIALDPLFDQVLVVGEGRPFLTALLVPEPGAYAEWLVSLDLDPNTPYDHPRVREAALERIAERLSSFPGYARILRVQLVVEPWTVDNGMMTPTMKLRRSRILTHHAEDVARLYLGH